MADDNKSTRRGFLTGNWSGKPDQAEVMPEAEAEIGELITETRDTVSPHLNRRGFLEKSGRTAAAVAAAALFTAIPVGSEAHGNRPEPRDTDQAHSSAFVEKATHEELMRPKEVQRMQNCQGLIFQHYLNPSFQIHLRRILTDWTDSANDTRTNAALQALETAMKYPHDMEYRETTKEYGDVIEITKRPSSTQGAIPSDFSIIVEGNYITRAGGRDLIDRRKKIPWKTPQKYTKQIGYERSQLNRFEGIYSGDWEEMIRDTPERLKESFNMVTVETIRRIQFCINYRNQAGQLDPSIDWTRINSLLAEHLGAYSERAQDRPMKIDIYGDTSQPGIYFVIDTSDYAADPLLVVSSEGYVMHFDEDAEKYVVDDYYKYIPERGANRIKDRYYEAEPNAASLTDIH
ncbi:twin-arginine translocation signal domain-containing protein [Patescibacteria group bacterium]|nr:twin-arginine translocation signal domain-containing protein [Patescibacteria group bacterium]